MKTLLLIRHAKSDWANMHARDFDRGLNNRGRRDAPFMAGYMAEEGYVPDAFVVSDACRAMQTATLMAPEFGISVDDIDWCHELYLASPQTLLATIHSTAPHIETLALLAHNPGITLLANQLCPAAAISNVPTCGIVTLSFDMQSWRDAGDSAELLRFDYPKSLD